jgi:hypothetical protein
MWVTFQVPDKPCVIALLSFSTPKTAENRALNGVVEFKLQQINFKTLFFFNCLSYLSGDDIKDEKLISPILDAAIWHICDACARWIVKCCGLFQNTL